MRSSRNSACPTSLAGRAADLLGPRPAVRSGRRGWPGNGVRRGWRASAGRSRPPRPRRPATGESFPGAVASWAASRTRPSPSAPTAPNPATAAAVGARRGLAGSQRVSRPVPAIPSMAAQAVTPAAPATRRMPTRRPGDRPVQCQGRPMRMPRRAAAAIQSRPTSGPVTSKMTATRRAWPAAISAVNPLATWAGSPNSRIAVRSAWSGGSPADRCASAASRSPERSSATMPAWPRGGPDRRAVTSAR